MINDKLIDVFLQNAKQEDLIIGIKQILNHLKIENSYKVAFGITKFALVAISSFV